MKSYLARYLVMYAVLAGVFAVVSAIVRFPSSLGVLIPGLLAALIGMGYVNDNLQAPTTRAKAEFAAIAAGISAAVGIGMLVLSLGLVRRAITQPTEGLAYPDARQVVTLFVLLFALNCVTIFIGVTLGARGALHRIAYPELHLDAPRDPGPTTPNSLPEDNRRP